jgi:hypothetical protein
MLRSTSALNPSPTGNPVAAADIAASAEMELRRRCLDACTPSPPIGEIDDGDHGDRADNEGV